MELFFGKCINEQWLYFPNRNFYFHYQLNKLLVNNIKWYKDFYNGILFKDFQEV